MTALESEPPPPRPLGAAAIQSLYAEVALMLLLLLLIAFQHDLPKDMSTQSGRGLYLLAAICGLLASICSVGACIKTRRLLWLLVIPGALLVLTPPVWLLYFTFGK